MAGLASAGPARSSADHINQDDSLDCMIMAKIEEIIYATRDITIAARATAPRGQGSPPADLRRVTPADDANAGLLVVFTGDAPIAYPSDIVCHRGADVDEGQGTTGAGACARPRPESIAAGYSRPWPATDATFLLITRGRMTLAGIACSRDEASGVVTVRGTTPVRSGGLSHGSGIGRALRLLPSDSPSDKTSLPKAYDPPTIVLLGQVHVLTQAVPQDARPQRRLRIRKPPHDELLVDLRSGGLPPASARVNGSAAHRSMTTGPGRGRSRGASDGS